jgi:hypothetical protein
MREDMPSAKEIEYNDKTRNIWNEVRKPEVLQIVKDKLQRFCDTLTEEELRVIDEEELVRY